MFTSRNNASLSTFLNQVKVNREAQQLGQALEAAPQDIKERIVRVAAQVEAKTITDKAKQ
ncbi:hypothetical protein [Oceanisphaera pacifica]|uniref:Uncharacterized protein n=1 Tax=Oceanisphaera pacifica TaxID=2818389 RepID=A0ABS3NCH4_9GAMM|nr:hypothetical protein [Oceanisphaera pacifica]MBO1518239.1 hypothetical protein [Oceanisphaera pacifica]